MNRKTRIKRQLILKRLRNMTNRKYPGMVNNVGPLQVNANIVDKNKPKVMPDIGFIGNAIKNIPGSTSRDYINKIIIQKINDSFDDIVDADTQEDKNQAFDYAISLLNTNPDLSKIDGKNHPLFQCIDKVIARVPEDKWKPIFNEIIRIMDMNVDSYNTILGGQTFLTFLFDKILFESNNPTNEYKSIDDKNLLEIFSILVKNVNLERKDNKKGVETKNILDYILFPHYNVKQTLRKNFIQILLNKNPHLECSTINAIFTLTKNTASKSYNGFDIINTLINDGENINVYKLPSGNYIENFQHSLTISREYHPIVYYNNTITSKFIPVKSDPPQAEPVVSFDILNTDEVETPVIHLLNMIKNITNIKENDKDESSDNEKLQKKCLHSIQLMLPVVSEIHLTLILKYLAANKMEKEIIGKPEIGSIICAKLRGFTKYPNPEVWKESIRKVKESMNKASNENKNKDKDDKHDKDNDGDNKNNTALTAEEAAALQKSNATLNTKIAEIKEKLDKETNENKKNQYKGNIEKMRETIRENNKRLHPGGGHKNKKKNKH